MVIKVVLADDHPLTREDLSLIWKEKKISS